MIGPTTATMQDSHTRRMPDITALSDLPPVREDGPSSGDALPEIQEGSEMPVHKWDNEVNPGEAPTTDHLADAEFRTSVSFIHSLFLRLNQHWLLSPSRYGGCTLV